MDSLHGLIREVLHDSTPPTPKVALDGANRYFSAVSRLDYNSALLSQFDQHQLREVVSELRHVLPALNQNVFLETSAERLAEIAARFGVLLRYGFFDGPGDTLRGFYLNDDVIIKQPTIFLNVAHHRVSRAAAFWHEMGHHLTHEIFGDHAEQISLLSTADYHKHLTDPKEIVADVVLALAGYPKPAARRMFGGSKGEKSNCEIARFVSKVADYIHLVAGFDLQRRVSRREKLNVLAGMIHIAKLRATLLNEYGI
ncbi:MAG TPA: hypothetical protein VNF29_09720 [Candidatus Binataceae bacterium]|nr:hypothetical protein [Candidatus Binataceae bacterium]